MRITLDTNQLVRALMRPPQLATAVYGSVDYLVTADADLKTPAVLQLLADAGIAVVESGELIQLLDRGYRS